MKRLVRFSKVQWVTIGAIIGFGLLNPFSVEVLDEYFKLFYTGVFLACAVWIAGFLLYKVLRPEQVHIPSKNAKTTKAGKFVTT